MHFFSYIATAAEEKKKILLILPWISQASYRILVSFFVVDDRKLTFRYLGQTDKLYWVASNYKEKKNRAANFHLGINLHECSAEFELGNVSAAGWLFYLVAAQGRSIYFSCSLNFVKVDFHNWESAFIWHFLLPEHGCLDSCQENRV